MKPLFSGLYAAVGFAILAAALPACSFADEASDEMADAFRVRMFGHLRLDLACDTRQLRRDEGVNRVARRFMGDGPEFWASANSTLIGVSVAAPWMLDGVAAVVAIDFANIVPVSDAASIGDRLPFEPRPRLRLAQIIVPASDWLRVDAGFGPDVFAPLAPDVIDPWRGIGAGDVGYERAGFVARFGAAAMETFAGDEWLGRRESTTIFGAMLGVFDPQIGVIGGRDVDGDNREDGRESGLPALQALLSIGEYGGDSGTDFRTRSTTPFLALSAHLSWQQITRLDGTQARPAAYAVALNARLPVLADLVLSLEMWFGQAVDAVAGNMTLTGIDPDTRRVVDAHGGWLALSWHPADADCAFSLTWGLDDPSRVDLYFLQGPHEQGQPDRIQFVAGTVRWFATSALTFAVEIAWWKTEFFETPNNESVRIQTRIEFIF